MGGDQEIVGTNRPTPLVEVQPNLGISTIGFLVQRKDF